MQHIRRGDRKNIILISLPEKIKKREKNLKNLFSFCGIYGIMQIYRLNEILFRRAKE